MKGKKNNRENLLKLYDKLFNYLRGYTNNAPEEYRMFLVMEKMGWDWQTYHNQPDDWIDTVEMIISVREDSLKHSKN